MKNIKIKQEKLPGYIEKNFKEEATLEITYNRVFIPGKILYIQQEDNNTIITLQLKGQLLNQVIEININEILDDIIELRYKDEKETVITVH